MSNETLYFTALNRLSSVTSGSTDFEKISHILIKFMYPDYDFKPPEGGYGTRDGGYDGYDPLKKAKLACSLEKDYKFKIKNEIEKNKKHGDLQLFYSSNQPISDVVKNQIEKNPDNQGIELFIFGIDRLSREIEKYFQKKNDVCLYDLLDLSSLKNGERYRRGDVQKLSIDYDGSLYPKKISIIENNDDMIGISKGPVLVGENPLFIYIHQTLCENGWVTFPNIFLSGIGYIGKTFLSRLTFNQLIDAFSIEENHFTYNCLPFLQNLDLKYYAENSIISKILNPIDPLLIFLDGLDEIAPSNRIVLTKEINRITSSNPRVRFIISGRDSSYAELSGSLYSVQTLRIEKYVDPYDMDLMQILNEYNATPIADLLPIPVYRNFIKDQNKQRFKSFASLVKTLIENNLQKDNSRNDYALNNPKQATPSIALDMIISKLSVFCLNLFYYSGNIFTEDVLRTLFQEDATFFFILQSSIIDYKNREHISFVSNFYYEYFVANGATKLNLFKAIKLFIRRNKIIISHLDVFVVFLKILSSVSQLKYFLIQRKALYCSVDFSLVCDFEIFSDNTRYYYFKKIFQKYNFKKKFIYYGRFRPEYGPLKNINNMAQKMQELLPEIVRGEALVILIAQIRRYLKTPNDDSIMAFANCITLLTPYIESLWDLKQQLMLQEISIPLLKFFLYNKYATNIKNMLSYHTILLWYKEFAWTKDWKQEEWDNFIKKIIGSDKTLDCEIQSDNEFALKITLFVYFHETKCLDFLLKPLLFYALKENKPVSVGKMQEIPAVITDKDTLPMMQTDHDLWGFYALLKNIDIPFELILELFVYIAKNNLKDVNHGIHDDPIKTLESQFYDKIEQLTEKYYQNFLDYFLRKETLIDMDRFFKKTKDQNFDNLKIYLMEKVCPLNMQISHWIIERLLSELLDLHHANQAVQQLKNLKILFSQKDNQGIYAGIVYETFHNQQHVLNKNTIIQNDYNTLFAARIASEKIHNEKRDTVKCVIADMLNREVLLVNDNLLLAEEVRKAIIYLNDDANFEEPRSFIGKIRTLSTEHILNSLEYFYGQDYKVPLVFSKTALFIIEKYIGSGYSENTVNDSVVISYLQKWQRQPFYIYFYWIFIDQYRRSDSNEWMATLFDTCPEIKQQILDSIDKDTRSKFTSLSIQAFDGMNSTYWIAPFIYFLKFLLDSNIPEWLTKENVLKLIACSNPMASSAVMSHNISLNWFEDLFLSKVTKHEIANFGIQIISLLQDSMAHIQILNYLIDYSDPDMNIKNRIFDYIVTRTKDMFQSKIPHDDLGEYSILSNFWSRCQENYIDNIFSVFSVNIILSTVRQTDTDIDYQYRKSVLEYCLEKSSVQQKQKIISEIKASANEMLLTGKQSNVVTQFLAALGDKDSIISIINNYLQGADLITPEIFSLSSFGCIEKSDVLLDKYIELLFYSIDPPDDQFYIRRENLIALARNGIQQHLRPKNFKVFERRINKHIIKLRKINKYTEFYEEFLLQMEDLVYSSNNLLA